MTGDISAWLPKLVFAAALLSGYLAKLGSDFAGTRRHWLPVVFTSSALCATFGLIAMGWLEAPAAIWEAWRVEDNGVPWHAIIVVVAAGGAYLPYAWQREEARAELSQWHFVTLASQGMLFSLALNYLVLKESPSLAQTLAALTTACLPVALFAWPTVKLWLQRLRNGERRSQSATHPKQSARAVLRAVLCAGLGGSLGVLQKCCVSGGLNVELEPMLYVTLANLGTCFACLIGVLSGPLGRNSGPPAADRTLPSVSNQVPARARRYGSVLLYAGSTACSFAGFVAQGYYLQTGNASAQFALVLAAQLFIPAIFVLGGKEKPVGELYPWLLFVQVGALSSLEA
jgi:hypothetical protein